MGRRRIVALVASLAVVVPLTVFGISRATPAHEAAVAPPIQLWSTQGLKGETTLAGQVPLSVSSDTAKYVHPHPALARISLDFGLPIVDKGSLDALIAQESKTGRYLSHTQLYARFSPPVAQYQALRSWLQRNGFQITHVGADRLALSATATTAQVERALHVKIDDFTSPGYTFDRVKVKAYGFYANTTAPKVPAYLGLQTISGLSNVDKFFTDVQLSQAAHHSTKASAPISCGDGSDGGTQGVVCSDFRSGGYFPSDLQGLYDITGHGVDGTGQTLGFTLWTTPERQAAMTKYASDTGDTPITVDMPSCNATGNSPETPSSCSQVQVQPDHLLTILEDGNSDSNANFGSNTETALDIEAAHGIATHAAMKYYAANCGANPDPNSGLANGSCNGTDVGMEEAVEDAANDPTLHTVSNSWGYGGEAEWGLTDPFEVAMDNSLAIGAGAGTTFYFGTGDFGDYESGYPNDSQYVVAVGGTSTYSTTNSAIRSTATVWDLGGSWCSNIIARPAWQSGPGVAATAPCPGRTGPDVSTIGDSSTGIHVVASSNLTGGTASGQIGGTSLSAPVMSGLEALTESFVAEQTYPGGAHPHIGFMGPMLYALGSSGHADSYYHDIVCGNTADNGNQTAGGPAGDAAGPGFDAASGWGEPDWFQFATGVALQLGATNLSVPPSLATGFAWSCANTPSNSSERGVSCGSGSVCYSVGTASSAPWPSLFLPSGAWGATNTFFKTTDGGQTWFPSNADMLSISCTSSSACVTVGDGGRIRTTSNGGTTWSDTTSPSDKALTHVTCPSSSVCYAVGDRGIALKSSDGGQTWSYLDDGDGNPAYGLSCPSASVCYLTDIYAHVFKTADGGTHWSPQTTPITTPGLDVAETGGPNPYGGLLSISCPSLGTCAATGLYVVPSGQPLPDNDPPVLTTTNGGLDWTVQKSNGGGTSSRTTTLSAAASVGDVSIKVASVTSVIVGQQLIVDSTGANPESVTVNSVGTSGAGGTGIGFSPALGFAHASGATVVENQPNYLHAISCVHGTTDCTAVGRNGAITSTTDLVNWTRATSGTTTLLDGVTCLSTSFCMAVGQNGTVDTFNGTTWTATTGNGGSGTLADVSCLSSTTCFATGKQGVTIATTNGGATWTQQAGGGTTQQANGVSCPSASNCFAVGNAGTILATSNGGQSWLTQTSGTTANLNAVSCSSTTSCVAVGAVASGSAVVEFTTNGSVWQAGTSGTANALSGVACTASTCTAVGAAGTILTSSNGGLTWTPATSGTTTTLSAVACPSTACFAVGNTAGNPARATIVATSNGTTWSVQSSNAAQSLTAVACRDASNCFAGGANGTLVTTNDGGTTWTQQGNPLSGPTTALNASNSTGLSLLSATCTSARCMMGTGTQGDMMTSPLLTVTVTKSAPFGTDPASVLGGAAANSGGISYSPAGEAANVTGALTCSTTATSASGTGSYPISSCSGLADNGFSVVYDYADSHYTVTSASQTITFASIPNHQFGDADFTISPTASSGLTVSLSASGACTVSSATSPATVHITGAGTCSITASQSGNANWSAATPVSRSFTISNSTSGTADGAGLQLPDGSHASFHVDAHNGSPTGNLTFDGPPPAPPAPPKPGQKPTPPAPPTPPFHFEANTITAFGIAADGKSAWFEGTDKSGTSFLVYIEDNGKPGPGGPGKPAVDPDVFKLWINGVLQTPADGSLTNGDVTINVPKAPPAPPTPPGGPGGPGGPGHP